MEYWNDAKFVAATRDCLAGVSHALDTLTVNDIFLLRELLMSDCGSLAGGELIRTRLRLFNERSKAVVESMTPLMWQSDDELFKPTEHLDRPGRIDGIGESDWGDRLDRIDAVVTIKLGVLKELPSSATRYAIRLLEPASSALSSVRIDQESDSEVLSAELKKKVSQANEFYANMCVKMSDLLDRLGSEAAIFGERKEDAVESAGTLTSGVPANDCGDQVVLPLDGKHGRLARFLAEYKGSVIAYRELQDAIDPLGLTEVFDDGPRKVGPDDPEYLGDLRIQPETITKTLRETANMYAARGATFRWKGDTRSQIAVKKLKKNPPSGLRPG